MNLQRAPLRQRSLHLYNFIDFYIYIYKRLNLFNLLRDDLKERKLEFNTMNDLLVVRERAKCRRVEVVGESCIKSGNTVYFLKMFSGDWILFDLYDPVYYI